MNKKVLYIFVIIILIIAGIFVGTKITENDKTKPVVANTLNNTNNTNEKNDIVENNTVEPEVNEVVNNIVEDEVETEKTENTNLSPEEQAKQIVKQNWGEDDDTVYYSYDGKDANGRYVICVREKDTTKALYRYYVDIETGNFEIE